MAAVWIPPGKQSFIDPDTGAPLEFGTLEHYIPSTTTPKATWADESQATLNPTIITLDAGGQCSIWGTGLYRQILRDQNGVQIWDLVTGYIASGGSGGGDVNGPGASTPGNFAIWGDSTGTQIGDGGVVGSLSHLSTIGDALWSGIPLGLNHGGTSATTAAGARAAFGLGALAVLSTITASFVTDFATAQLANSITQLVAGTNMSLDSVSVPGTIIFNATGGSGGGDVTGPGASTANGLVLFNGTTGKIIKDGATVPSANGLSLISAANYAAMLTLLGIGTAGLQNTGTSGATIPFLNGTNTWAATQTFTVAPVFTAAAGTRTALGLGTAAVAATTDFEPAGAYVGQNAQTGTTYTLVLGDKGWLVTMSNASGNTLTVPTNASVAFPVLTRIDLASLGSGQTTIAAAGGVTINSVGAKLKLTTQYSGASLVKTGTNTWLLIGDLST